MSATMASRDRVTTTTTRRWGRRRKLLAALAAVLPLSGVGVMLGATPASAYVKAPPSNVTPVSGSDTSTNVSGGGTGSPGSQGGNTGSGGGASWGTDQTTLSPGAQAWQLVVAAGVVIGTLAEEAAPYAAWAVLVP